MNIPEFTLNLDLPPRERWREVGEYYRDHAVTLEYATQARSREVAGAASHALPWWFKRYFKLMDKIDAYRNSPCAVYYQEMRGLAESLGVSLSTVLTLNYGYEFNSYCSTAIVDVHESDANGGDGGDGTHARVAGGVKAHLRTLDWSLGVLKNMVAKVHFERDGQRLFTSFHLVGIVGVVTGLSYQGKFSCAVNYRDTYESGPVRFGKSIWRIMDNCYPVSFLMRRALEESSDYRHAVAVLSNNRLISYAYFSVCGPDQGCIIVRGRGKSQRFTGNLVQTNHDVHCPSHAPSDRVDKILSGKTTQARYLALANLLSEEGLTQNKCLDIMQSYPVTNQDTIYGVLMFPSDGTYIINRHETLNPSG